MVKVMLDPTKEKTERERAVKKLIKKWRTTQETKQKAILLLEKNPDWKTGHPGRISLTRHPPPHLKAINPYFYKNGRMRMRYGLAFVPLVTHT